MRKLFKKLEKTLADAALHEMGVMDVLPPAAPRRTFREALEEKLIEVAFAEAADYDEIHKALLREHDENSDEVRPDDCRCVVNDMCFVH